MIVDRAGEVVETRPVGPLHDVVLFERPLECDISPHEVVKCARPLSGHFQPHRGLASLRLERGGLRVGLGHPATAVEKPPLLVLGGVTLRLDLLRRRIIAIGGATRQQRSRCRLVSVGTLGLVVGRIRPVDLGALIPLEAKPSEPVQNRLERLGQVALRVRIVDAQQELPTVAPREQPVEQRGTDATDVEIASRTWREAGTDRHLRNDYNDGRRCPVILRRL